MQAQSLPICTDLEQDVSVSKDALDALLPLHLQVDAGGCIVDAGRTFKKLFRHVDLVGQSLHTHLRLSKPRYLANYQQLSELAGQKLVFKMLPEGAGDLQAMVVPLRTPSTWLINFSLGSDLSDVVERFSLHSKDFSLVDSTVDLMQVAAMQADLLATSRDLTSRLEESRQDAERRALTDELTGLPNRRALHQHLASYCAATPEDDVQLNVLHIDLDNFKNINDTHGHAIGDRVLETAANIIRSATRPVDFVGRTGGDEFVVVLGHDLGPEDARQIAQRIVTHLSEPIRVGEHTCQIGASVGLNSCANPDQHELDQIIIDADRALYEAKNSGRGQFRAFDHSLRARYDKINALGTYIIDAIEADQFLPFFQPKVSLENKQLWGVEALARWQHPKLGTLSAGHFLAAAQQANLVSRLDDSIMRKAFRAVADWEANGLFIPHVSINVTSARLSDPGFVELLLTAAAEAGILPSRVGLEVLETVLIEETSKQLITNIERLSKLGFIVELDDFGTGHASISNLRRIPVDVVKIDRSLINGIDADAGLRRITGSIVELLNSLEIAPLAEGVESASELAVLEELNCAIVQGYHLAQPMPFGELMAWAKVRQVTRGEEPSGSDQHATQTA